MTRPPDDYWFPAKRYGWGWGVPRRWQGWVVLLVYFGLVFAGMWAFLPARGEMSYLVFLGAITAILIVICWWKGEPPRWRWGGK